MESSLKKIPNINPEGEFFFDLNLAEDARNYLRLWEAAGLLEYEDNETADSLDDSAALCAAKEIFLNFDKREPNELRH